MKTCYCRSLLKSTHIWKKFRWSYRIMGEASIPTTPQTLKWNSQCQDWVTYFWIVGQKGPIHSPKHCRQLLMLLATLCSLMVTPYCLRHHTLMLSHIEKSGWYPGKAPFLLPKCYTGYSRRRAIISFSQLWPLRAITTTCLQNTPTGTWVARTTSE